MKITKEYLEDRFRDKGWNYEQMMSETGKSKSHISAMISKYGLRKKKNRLVYDLTGQKIGKWKVLHKGPTIKHCVTWTCECECGTIRNLIAGNILKGWTNGCMECCKRSGADNSGWKGIGLLGSRYYNIIKSNAEKRNIFFDISIEYIWNLFIEQGNKCALTGWELTLVNNTSQTASLDRIDSNKGYVEGNVQWLHKDVNKAKNIYGQEYFIQMCKAISEKNK